MLVLSATMSFLDVSGLAEAVRRSREAAGNGLHIAVGGRAFDLEPALVKQLGAEIYGRSAPESVARARQVLGLQNA